MTMKQSLTGGKRADLTLFVLPTSIPSKKLLVIVLQRRTTFAMVRHAFPVLPERGRQSNLVA